MWPVTWCLYTSLVCLCVCDLLCLHTWSRLRKLREFTQFFFVDGQLTASERGDLLTTVWDMRRMLSFILNSFIEFFDFYAVYLGIWTVIQWFFELIAWIMLGTRDEFKIPMMIVDFFGIFCCEIWELATEMVGEIKSWWWLRSCGILWVFTRNFAYLVGWFDEIYCLITLWL